MKPKTIFLTAAAGFPLLVSSAMAATWTGANNNSWADAGNWTGTPPDNTTPQAVLYDSTSTANLSQALNGSYTVTGITVTNPSGQITIGNGTGANTLIIGSGGFDLSSATQDLILNGGTLALGADQTWDVAADRMLAVDGVTRNFGSSNVNIIGGGTVRFGGSASVVTTFGGAVTFSGANTVALTGGGGVNPGDLGLNFGGGADFGGAVQTFNTDSENRSVSGTVSNGTLRLANNHMQFKAASTGVFNLIADGSGAQIILNNTAINNSQLNVNLVNGGTGGNRTALRLAAAFNNATAIIGNLTGDANSFVSTNFGAATGVTRTLEVNQSVDGTFAGQLTQADGNRQLVLVKQGGATLTLTGTANSYTGGTTVSAGTLLANNASGSATGTGMITVGAGGILGGTGFIAPTGANGINVTGVIAPGAGVGTLTFNLAGTTGNVTILEGGGFQFELGSAGLSIGNVGSSDMLAIAGAAAGDFVFAAGGNEIDFMNTGVLGWYKLFDTSLDASTWENLTVDGGTGEITGGLTYTNLAGGLTGTFYMGGEGSIGGSGDLGDIYFRAIPEPSAALLGALGSLLFIRRRR